MSHTHMCDMTHPHHIMSHITGIRGMSPHAKKKTRTTPIYPYSIRPILGYNKKQRELATEYKRQNSALLHAQAHDIKVTPFNATMNTAWQLIHDYKSNEATGKPQLPSQMRTICQPTKDCGGQDPSRETLHLASRVITNISMPLAMISEDTLIPSGMKMKLHVYKQTSTRPTPQTHKYQTHNSTFDQPEKK